MLGQVVSTPQDFNTLFPFFSAIHYLQNLKITLLPQIPFVLYFTSVKTFPLLSSFSHLMQWSIKHLLKSNLVNISTWGQELCYLKFTFVSSLLNDVPCVDLLKKPVSRQFICCLCIPYSALALIFFINNPTSVVSLCVLLFPIVVIYLLSAPKQDEDSVWEWIIQAWVL